MRSGIISALLDAWRVIRRHRLTLFVTIVLSVLAGVLLILFSTPGYRATASVEVEDVPAGAAGAGGARISGAPVDIETLMQTQIEVLRSRALASDVAQELALVGSPRFFDGMNAERPAQGAGSLSQRQVETEAVLALLRDNLTVDRPGRSRILRIGFTSPDPAWSARVANSFADSLIRSDLKRGFQSGVQARRFLLGELDGARQDLERAERDLAAYAVRTGTMPSPEAEGADAGDVRPRIDQLNALRTQAVADRIAAGRRWELARHAALDSLPEVIGNGAMQQLMAERAAARATLTGEREFRTDAHPEMREARARLVALDEQAQAMARNIRGSLKDQYEVAAHGERQIDAEIASLERRAVVERSRDVQIGMMERSVDTYRMLHDSLLQRYRDMASQAGFQAGRIQPLDRAAPPARPSSPDIGITMLLASLGGLAVGLLLVAGRHLFDDAVTSADTLAERVDLPLLGTVPMTGGSTGPADIFDGIAASLQLASIGGLPASILVTSAQAGEGKSATLHALALALARLGKSVLVIDGDMRRPAQHSLFRLPPGRGISEVMAGQAEAEAVIVDSGTPGVSILGCGAMPPNPGELLSTNALQRLLADLRPRYDTVLIDSPPILGLPDAPLLAAKVQATVMVVEWGRNHHGGLRVAVERLTRAGAAPLGVILTKQQGRADDYDYHRIG
ncbi:MAG: polysaccharide biosynthesis tyrosine autokinase [Sphingobium sp.]